MYPEIKMFVLNTNQYEINIKRLDRKAIGADELYQALEDTMSKYFNKPKIPDLIELQQMVVKARRIEHEQTKASKPNKPSKPSKAQPVCTAKIDRSKYPKIVKARQAGMTTKELAKIYKVATHTIQRIVKLSGESVPEHRGRHSKIHSDRIELSQPSK